MRVRASFAEIPQVGDWILELRTCEGPDINCFKSEKVMTKAGAYRRGDSLGRKDGRKTWHFKK